MVTEAMMQAARFFWDGLCDITVYIKGRNPQNGQTEFVEMMLHAAIPCHLSYKSVDSTGKDEDVATVQQVVKLFLAPEVSVPEGSKIVVTHRGVTSIYKQSGKPAVYPSRQEIGLVPFERWA